jgi:DNA polymerase III subunit epsilon
MNIGWAAIDFETANADPASACALGLVVVQQLQIVKRRSWLVRPSQGCFDPNNVMLHGITADQVAEVPTFAELWDEIHSEIQGMSLVAHNAGFDIGVLRHTLDSYKIPYPQLHYYCSRAAGPLDGIAQLRPSPNTVHLTILIRSEISMRRVRWRFRGLRL